MPTAPSPFQFVVSISTRKKGEVRRGLHTDTYIYGAAALPASVWYLHDLVKKF